MKNSSGDHCSPGMAVMTLRGGHGGPGATMGTSNRGCGGSGGLLMTPKRSHGGLETGMMTPGASQGGQGVVKRKLGSHGCPGEELLTLRRQVGSLRRDQGMGDYEQETMTMTSVRQGASSCGREVLKWALRGDTVSSGDRASKSGQGSGAQKDLNGKFNGCDEDEQKRLGKEYREFQFFFFSFRLVEVLWIQNGNGCIQMILLRASVFQLRSLTG